MGIMLSVRFVCTDKIALEKKRNEWPFLVICLTLGSFYDTDGMLMRYLSAMYMSYSYFSPFFFLSRYCWRIVISRQGIFSLNTQSILQMDKKIWHCETNLCWPPLNLANTATIHAYTQGYELTKLRLYKSTVGIFDIFTIHIQYIRVHRT